MWPPTGCLIPGAVPTGIIPGEGGPIVGIMGGPPYGVLVSYQGKRIRKTGGRWTYCPQRRRSRKWNRRYLSLLKCCGCLCQSASEPTLPSTSESSLSLCFLPLQCLSHSRSPVCIAGRHRKIWACCSTGRWPLLKRISWWQETKVIEISFHKCVPVSAWLHNHCKKSSGCFKICYWLRLPHMKTNISNKIFF